MLVKGWTIIGHIGSSYVNTMGFRASARVEEETTRSCDTPPLFYLIKSISYQALVLLKGGWNG